MLSPPTLGYLWPAVSTNLGSVTLLTGRTSRAAAYLEHAIGLCDDLLLVRFSALDAMASLGLHSNELGIAQRHFDECEKLSRSFRIPAASWYDMAHEVTRCAYHERLGDWAVIIDRCDKVDRELSRRQYKADPHGASVRQGAGAVPSRRPCRRRPRVGDRRARLPARRGRSPDPARGIQGRRCRAPRRRARATPTFSAPSPRPEPSATAITKPGSRDNKPRSPNVPTPAPPCQPDRSTSPIRRSC